MLRLSILVPFRGNPKRFEDTLVSVLENRPERSEVVVVTNRPYDDPYDLRGEVAFAEALKNADLLVCFATGLAVSHGQVVHLLGEGFEATPGWAEAALARFDEPDVAAVVPLVLDRQRPERIVFAGLCYASSGAIARIGTGGRADHFASNEQTLGGPELGASFYRRDALAAVGSLPNYGSECAAAVDLALSLRSLGYRCVQAADCVMTATGDLLAPASGWRDGLAEERLFRYWAAGTSSAAPLDPVGNHRGSLMPRSWQARLCKFRCGQRNWPGWPDGSVPHWPRGRAGCPTCVSADRYPRVLSFAQGGLPRPNHAPPDFFACSKMPASL